MSLKEELRIQGIEGRQCLNYKNKRSERIVYKLHARLQAMTGHLLTSVQTNLHTIVGGFAHTRYPPSIHFNTDNSKNA